MAPLHFCATSNESADICDTQFLTMYTVAAYLPEDLGASPEERRLAENFFVNFVDQCRDVQVGGVIEREKRNLEFGSRRELLLSICSMENVARMQAGLPLAACSYSRLMQRWRYPDGYL